MASRNERISSSELSDSVADVSDPQKSGCCRPQLDVNVAKRKCCSRMPAGKALWLALILNSIESFVFFEMLIGLSGFVVFHKSSTGTSWGSLLAPVAVESFGKLFYPIGGLVADVWLGRKRVIHTSMWLLWITLISLTITVLVLHKSSTVYYVIISVLFVLFSIGIGGFETNIIPLGMNQLQSASAEELSSYIYWYYWTKQIGGLGGILVFFTLRYFDSHLLVLQPLAATLVFSVGMVLYPLFNNWLIEDAMPNNPLKLIIKVTCYALTVKRGPPQYRRAFRYGEERKSRFELAKKDFDGIYENEDVENVKTFCQICMVLASYILYCFTYGLAFVALDYQAYHLLFSIHNTSAMPGVNFLSNNLGTLLNTCGLIVALPAVNFASSFLYSSSLYSKRTLRVKMGIGHVLLLLSSLVLISIARTHNFPPSPLTSLLLLLMPGIFLFLSEMFGIVTLLEFISAQAPENTKGLLIGLFWFIFGLFNGTGRLVFTWIEHEYKSIDDPIYNFALVLYVIPAIVFAALGLLVYVIVAAVYRNRERPQPDEEDLVIQAYATSYYS